ncbi:MAG: DUF3574 domain-containing protein [Beijerinckiaceae bacterium]|nr:DUF3574 domain-containing protein [Beijerinckiaceae bacterium]
MQEAEPHSPCRPGSKLLARVELYFGAGGSRHAAAWRGFLAQVVTPRFPDGFTVLDGAGQWRGPRGVTREASHVLIVFYEPSARSDQALDAIRAAYKARFRQQSVLRVDSTACVAF